MTATDSGNGPRASLTDEVRQYLSEAIRVGEYVPGSRLPSENALASQYGVSRPVVREAVSRLAAEGLVRAERGRGTFVSERPTVSKLEFEPISGIDDLIVWQDFRIAVEQEAARLAAERRSPEDLERICGIHEKLVDMARSGNRAIDLDFDLHVAIAQATQNRILTDAQRSLGDHIRNWMTAILATTKRPPSERHELRNREHAAIVDAIARMDPDAAARAARRHLENGRTRLLTEISQLRV